MMAMDSSLDTLRKISGKDTDELVMLDIQQAQKGALSNMRTFVDAFAKSLHRLIKKTNKKILSTRDTSQSSHDIEDLGKLCVHLASMPYISHKIDMTPCYGKKLKAMIKGGPETTLITEKYLQKQFSERNCEMRNYLRKSKIYREWDIKL